MTRTGALLLAFLAGLLAVPSGASAALTVKVVDEHGRPQVAHVHQGFTGQTLDRVPMTDANGHFTLTDWAPGRYYVTRGFGDVGDCRAPEGPNGAPIDYQGENDTRGEITVVLPSLVTESADPGLNPEERKFVDLWNQHRVSLGLNPVKMVSVLSYNADWFSNFLNRNVDKFLAWTKAGRYAHCLYASPAARARASQFTGKIDVENVAYAWDATVAWEGFMNSPPHRKALEEPRLQIAGVGVYGWMWTVLASADSCPDCEPASSSNARTLGDHDQVDVPGDRPASSPPASSPRMKYGRISTLPAAMRRLKTGRAVNGRRPQLQLKLARRGRTLVIRFTARNGSGIRYLQVRRGKTTSVWRLRPKQKQLKIRPVKHGQTYRITGYFDGASPWGDMRTKTRVWKARKLR